MSRIGYVASQAPGGTTSEPQVYRLTDDEVPYSADSLRYRLRQVDLDGPATLTDPITVVSGGVSSLQLEETYPNPARGGVTVRYAVPERAGAEGEVRLRLYDVLGRRVRSAIAGPGAGRHETQLSVDDLASGVYILRLTAGGTSETQRLTVVR